MQRSIPTSRGFPFTLRTNTVSNKFDPTKWRAVLFQDVYITKTVQFRGTLCDTNIVQTLFLFRPTRPIQGNVSLELNGTVCLKLFL